MTRNIIQPHEQRKHSTIVWGHFPFSFLYCLFCFPSHYAFTNMMTLRESFRMAQVLQDSAHSQCDYINYMFGPYHKKLLVHGFFPDWWGTGMTWIDLKRYTKAFRLTSTSSLWRHALITCPPTEKFHNSELYKVESINWFLVTMPILIKCYTLTTPWDCNELR